MRYVCRMTNNPALIDRIDALAAQQGLSDRALALKAGLKPHDVRNIRRGHAPRPATLAALAKTLGVPVGHLLDATPSAPAMRLDPAPGAAPVEPRPADLPVYSTRQDGADAMWRDAEPVDRIARPPLLHAAPRGFALYVTGESASPAYDQGDLVFVSPGLPVTRGADVLLVSADETRVTVKRVVSWTDKVWRVRQFSPSRETELSRQIWPVAHMIVGKYNRH